MSSYPHGSVHAAQKRLTHFNIGQLMVLRAMAALPEGRGLPPSEIARLQGSSSGAATGTKDRFVCLGIGTELPCLREDRRVRPLAITPKGRAVLAEIEAFIEKEAA